MNEYRITYSVNGRDFTANRVDRTEAKDAEVAAAEIVKHADDPAGLAFLEARNAHRIAQHDAEVVGALLDRVKAANT